MTISDVARRAGSSSSTVSRHLMGQRVRSADEIEDAINELGYRPSPMARSLRSGKTLTLGLVVPDITNPFFTGVVHGAESVANEAGYQLLVGNTDEQTVREALIIDRMADRVDGLLLTPIREDATTSSLLASVRIPVTLIDRAMPDSNPTDSVLIENHVGAFTAARHLLGLGHRRIGLISGPTDTTPGRERHEGFLEAANDTEDIELAIEIGDFREASGYQATMRLFGRRGPVPTALFAANNLMTVGALRALDHLGIAIPDAVSVIGFDDHPLADLLNPPLTVIDRPTEAQGAIAARLLLGRLSGARPDPPRTIRLETSLVIRQSTSRPASSSVT